MEEILNAWNKDLNSRTREFHKQAAQVAEWDKQLIENGTKISKLNNDVERVEEQQREIDHNLEYINAQQEELNRILDSYENQIGEVYEQSNLQQPMQAADTQREKAYGLAENLNKQMDDINRNLTVMIAEINKMGGPQNSVPSNEDDVVGQIVKILNSHLSSLQWIDATSATLKQKLDDVNKLRDSTSPTHQ
ncbi:Nsp1-like C-terminal region-domain-containing protein [Chlamydoabsidia padenii]|nr:Nsp1-like C-terminal region-domain-containing protein [Chlamydoabsidia padenii]